MSVVRLTYVLKALIWVSSSVGTTGDGTWESVYGTKPSSAEKVEPERPRYLFTTCCRLTVQNEAGVNWKIRREKNI
jgi:hypothetical protein